MRTSRLLVTVALFVITSTAVAQVEPSVIGTAGANAPATLKLESRMEYVDEEHKITPIKVAVQSVFSLNLDTSVTSSMIFTGAGAVTHTLLDVSAIQSLLPSQCSVSLTAGDGSMVARIRYSGTGDPVLEIGNVGSVVETLAFGGLCAYPTPPRAIWGAPFAVLHQDEMTGAAYYQFSIADWTQIGPLTPDGPITFFRDYSRATSTIGDEPLAPLVPVNEVRETTHIEFTIYARSPVNEPTPKRRRSVRH